MSGTEAFAKLLVIVIYAVAFTALSRRRTLRQTAAVLRQLPQPEREQLLAAQADKGLRNSLALLLREDRPLEDQASVARFHFAPGTRADERSRALKAGAVILGSFGIIFVSGAVNPNLNTLCVIVGTTGALFCAYRLRRLHHMARTIEVSPFNLTEISGRGGRRVLPWNQPLELRNRPWRRRIEVGPPGLTDPICLDYHLLEFERAVALVMHYGGFVPASPAA